MIAKYYYKNNLRRKTFTAFIEGIKKDREINAKSIEIAARRNIKSKLRFFKCLKDSHEV